jgi:hypothetical protein
MFVMWWLVRLALAFCIFAGGAAHAAAPDCSGGQHWFGNGTMYGFFPSAQAYYGALFAAQGGGDEAGFIAYWEGTASVTPSGAKIVDSPYGAFVYSPTDVCAVGEASTGGTGGGGSVGTVTVAEGSTVAINFPEVTDTDYAAVTGVFAAGFGAICLLWSLAALVRFFNSSPDA